MESSVEDFVPLTLSVTDKDVATTFHVRGVLDGVRVWLLLPSIGLVYSIRAWIRVSVDFSTFLLQAVRAVIETQL